MDNIASVQFGSGLCSSRLIVSFPPFFQGVLCRFSGIVPTFCVTLRQLDDVRQDVWGGWRVVKTIVRKMVFCAHWIKTHGKFAGICHKTALLALVE